MTRLKGVALPRRPDVGDVRLRPTLETGLVTLVSGLALLTGSIWATNLGLFMAGAIVVVAATALIFHGGVSR